MMLYLKMKGSPSLSFTDFSVIFSKPDMRLLKTSSTIAILMMAAYFPAPHAAAEDVGALLDAPGKHVSTAENSKVAAPVYLEELLATDAQQKKSVSQIKDHRNKQLAPSVLNNPALNEDVAAKARELRERAKAIVARTRASLKDYFPAQELALEQPPRPEEKPVTEETIAAEAELEAQKEEIRRQLMELAGIEPEEEIEPAPEGIDVTDADGKVQTEALLYAPETDENPPIPLEASEDILSDEVGSEHLLRAPGYATILGQRPVALPMSKKKIEDLPAEPAKESIGDVAQNVEKAGLAADPFMSRPNAHVDTPLRISRGQTDVDLARGNILFLETAIDLALRNAPEIDVRTEQIRQAELDLQGAKADFYPDIQSTYSYGRVYRDPSTNAQGAGGGDQTMQDRKSIVFNQVLFNGLRTIAEVRRTRKLIKRANYQRVRTMEEVTQKVIEAYLDVLQFQRTARDADAFIKEMENLVEKISIMERAGNISVARLNLAKSRLASAKTNYQNSTASYNDAISTLESLTGPLPEFVAVDPLTFDVSAYTLDTYVDYAEKNNLQLIMNEISEQALKDDFISERGTYFPTLNLQMRGEEETNKTEDPKIDQSALIKLEANWILFDGFSRKAFLNKLKSQIYQTRHERERLRKDIEKDIKLSFNQTVSLRDSIKTQDEDIENNEKLQRINKQSFELGDVDIFELIEEEQRIFNSRATKHELVRNKYLNEYSLLLVTGLLRPEDFKHTLDLQKEVKGIEL